MDEAFSFSHMPCTTVFTSITVTLWQANVQKEKAEKGFGLLYSKLANIN